MSNRECETLKQLRYELTEIDNQVRHLIRTGQISDEDLEESFKQRAEIESKIFAIVAAESQYKREQSSEARWFRTTVAC